MAKQLLGKEVTAALNEKIKAQVAELESRGVKPTLGIIRVGERPDDVSYERGATKRCETLGVAYEKFLLPADVTQEELMATLDKANKDDNIHGILIFRPLPKHLDEAAVIKALKPEKDVDGITDGSMVGVFAGTKQGFPPCTPCLLYTSRTLVLGCTDVDTAKAALEVCKDSKPVLNGADASNYEAMNTLAKEAGVVLGVRGADLNELHTTVEKLEALGNKDLILDVGCASVKEAFANAVQIRRSAIKDGDRTFGYPSLVNAAALAKGDIHMQAALASLLDVYKRQAGCKARPCGGQQSP